MKREVVELVCDNCGKSESDGVIVEVHRVALDGVAYDAEVCDPCWTGRFLEVFAMFARVGRLVPKTRVKRDAVAFPGTPWKFSSHAMKRIGERKLDPVELLKVVESPDSTRPGNSLDLEIREGRRLKVVVAPERLVIVTAARNAEDLAEAMP